LDSINNKQNNIIENEYLNLNNIFKILIRRKKYFFSFGSLAFIFVLLITAYNRIFEPVFKGNFTLLISDPMSNGRSNGISEDIQLFEDLASNKTSNDLPTLIEYLKSPLLINPVAKKYNYTYLGLSKNISIRTGGDISKSDRYRAKGILKVELLTKNPKKDLTLLKELSNLYLQTSLTQRQQRLRDGLDFLDNQEPILQKKNNDLESELVAFREKFSLIEPSIEMVSLKTQEEKLNELLQKLTSERNTLFIVKEEILKGTISSASVDEVINKNKIDDLKIKGDNTNKIDSLKIKDYDQSLLKQINFLENEISQKRTIFKENSNIIKRLKLKLKELKPALRDSQSQAVETALRLNYAKIKDIESKLDNLKNIFLEKPTLIKEFNSLQQKLSISQRNLLALVSARENFQFKIAQSSVPWKILEDPFIDRNPLKPSISRGFFSAIFIGLVSGIFAALIRDKTDYVFHSNDEIKEAIDLPILGTIPNIDVFNNLLIEGGNVLEMFDIKNFKFTNKEKRIFMQQKFLYQESLRNFYTSIRFLSTDKKIRILTNTSSIPSEGKTLINILLAKTIAELGQKVLLIDADLRKPQIHKRLGMNNLKGLSNFLIEKSYEIKNIVQKVDKIENLSVITAGTVVPDPARLLSSDKMKSFMKNLSTSEEYDYVLIDSPPILGLSDSIINSELIDGYILLISIGKIARNIPSESVNRIRASKTPLLGIVTNRLIKDKKQKNIYSNEGYEYALTDSYFTNEELINDSNEESSNVDNVIISKIKKNILYGYLQRTYQKIKPKFYKIIEWLDR